MLYPLTWGGPKRMNILLASLTLLAISFPVVYVVGKKSAKASGMTLLLAILSSLILITLTYRDISLKGEHLECYYWLPILGSPLTLFTDGIGLLMATTALTIMFFAVLYSLGYMSETGSLAEYYALMTLLTVGLVGIFLTSNLLVFYFCWEFMLVPTYFILIGWGGRKSIGAAFKFFIFTHAGAVAILLGIGATYFLTGTLDILEARTLISSAPKDLLFWIFLAYLGGFLTKMAIVPFHIWLPDTYVESPIPLAAILSGVVTEAGAYGILRIPFGMVLPAIINVPLIHQTFHLISVLGVISAIYGSMIALVDNNLKRIAAYSSISHMGYILFGLSLCPTVEGMTGTVLHLLTHGISKSLLFLNVGAIIKCTGQCDIRRMGGLASIMPLTSVSTAVSLLSIAGVPPLACFLSEFLIFTGGFSAGMVDGLYSITTSLMLLVTVLGLGYSIRLFGKVFFGSLNINSNPELPLTMVSSIVFLSLLTVALGIYPSPVLKLISINALPLS